MAETDWRDDLMGSLVTAGQRVIMASLLATGTDKPQATTGFLWHKGQPKDADARKLVWRAISDLEQMRLIWWATDDNDQAVRPAVCVDLPACRARALEYRALVLAAVKEVS